MTTEEISNKTKVRNFCNVISKKILRLEPEEVSCSTGAERVVASMKTTAVSRYHASTRLAWQSKIAFLTTTILSLGLIFIPLMQLAQIPLRLNANVLSAVQIFMAVAILVYSVIIGTAKYETRCENLNDCGDKIKDLIRELRREMDADKNVEKTKLEDIQKRYAFIVADVENHQRCDYSLTILRNRDLYEISLFCLIKYKILYYFIILLNYIPTILLLTIEFIIISDMFGITTIFSFLGARG